MKSTTRHSIFCAGWSAEGLRRSSHPGVRYRLGGSSGTLSGSTPFIKPECWMHKSFFPASDGSVPRPARFRRQQEKTDAGSLFWIQDSSDFSAGNSLSGAAPFQVRCGDYRIESCVWEILSNMDRSCLSSARNSAIIKSSGDRFPEPPKGRESGRLKQDRPVWPAGDRSGNEREVAVWNLA